MQRREAVQYISLLLGGTLVGSNIFITGCDTKPKDGDTKPKDADSFSETDIALLDEVGDTILPATSTPGAKAAQIGQFMTIMVNDCYEPANQKVFKEGMKKLDELSKKQFDNGFVKASPQQRKDLLIQLDKEQKDYMKNKKSEDPSHYFRMMKELTLLGYFTSEVGTKQARRHTPVPGRFDACIPYKKGDKAFS
jgi:hypothetical protein